MPTSSQSWMRCVALTGLLVGVADYGIGVGVFVGWLGRPALGVLQAPAAGVLGPAAFRGRLPTAALGTVLHFAIALGWAGTFALLYAHAPALRKQVSTRLGFAIVSAVAGSLIWVVMNNVIAPLSRARAEPFGTSVFWTVLIGHIVLVGVPLVWGTRRFAPR